LAYWLATKVISLGPLEITGKVPYDILKEIDFEPFTCNSCGRSIRVKKIPIQCPKCKKKYRPCRFLLSSIKSPSGDLEIWFDLDFEEGENVGTKKKRTKKRNKSHSKNKRKNR
jgi:hypothetical protein